MKYDISLDIATGATAGTLVWKNKKILWSEMVKKLSEAHHTRETYKEFIAYNKTEQGKIKDVGGYVGGYLRGGKRSPQNVLHRQIMTLDIDFAHVDFWDDFLLQFDNAAVIHGTHKHNELSPRYRLVIPLDREATPDEYVAVSRKIAGILNIDLFDNTTFETNRLMFWPSSPRDVDYYFEFQDGPVVSVDEILAKYVDWTDSSAWPTAARVAEAVRSGADKLEDPELKKGIVGAFCRTYSITEAIEKFLSSEYVATTTEGRYTYLKGSTAGGLVVYDDKFAYSHHGTDPSGGRLSNAFDLVRLHKFGHLDNESRPGAAPESYKAMEEFSRRDKGVKKIIATESLQDSKYDFSEPIEISEDDVEWMPDLEVDSKGKYLSTANNINLIFANDIRLKGLFKQNDFDGKRYINGNLPWRKVTGAEPVKNVDYSGVRNYIESIYGISGTVKIDDSLALEFEKNSFHPIQDYLRALKWDGVKRVDTLLIKYFGADDTLYSREAIRKTLVGGVARIYSPGCKFDLVLTLVSHQQGTGKSSFFKALGREWFSDTFMSVQGKDALEQIQGAWIIEMAELSGVRKAEAEAVKHFISKQEDMFRPAYARTSETFKRQCIFVASTNIFNFLKDATGNRRFLPMDIHNVKLIDNPALKEFLSSKAEIDQVWAEAVALFKDGEPLHLSKDAEAIAEGEQRNHSETDERQGLIEKYLDTPLTPDWPTLDIYERRARLDADELTPKGSQLREFVCVAEVWCECLGKEKTDMDKYKTREINDILKSLYGWEQVKSTKNFPIYGTQKYYKRCKL